MANRFRFPWSVLVALMPRAGSAQLKITTMLSPYNWRFTDSLRGESRINQKLDALMPMCVISSQLKHCTVCSSNLDQYHMRYRIYCCKSEPCLSALISCKFKLKTLTCERTKQSHLHQHDDHFAVSAPNLRPQLSLLR
ncbi:hypothetical protein F441_21887 [Phytophthora nicotianae CJ01A1]|uniref:Secreted protein n=1 Tax=Phytophthora nicotianae CJ01A1 TaxID=1317063 RepID=W2VRC4_PHYNI|nr:hypothetical protein F441_21887 [Phytophthora nicotianae CJ01A1]